MVRDFPFIKQVFAFEAAVEQRSIFEHGAGDVEETITNCEESASMDAAAGSQGQDTWHGNAFCRTSTNSSAKPAPINSAPRAGRSSPAAR